jgi:hypothetical protein
MGIENQLRWKLIIEGTLGILNPKHVDLLCDYCHNHATLENELARYNTINKISLLPLCLHILSKINLDKVKLNPEIKTHTVFIKDFSIDNQTELWEVSTEYELFIIENTVRVLNLASEIELGNVLITSFKRIQEGNQPTRLIVDGMVKLK